MTLIATICPVYLILISLAGPLLETDAGIGTSIERLKEEWQMKELAARLDQEEGTAFWSEAVEFTLDKCCPDFALELRQNFLENNGFDNSTKRQMNDFIKQQTMRGCCKKFADRVDKWNELQASIIDLHKFASHYRLDQHEEADVVWRVSDLMKTVSPIFITNLDDFESTYQSHSPCAELYATVKKSDELIDYLHFIRLAGMPGYFERVTEQHINNVHIMALCDHIDRTDGLMSLAYYVYQQ